MSWLWGDGENQLGELAAVPGSHLTWPEFTNQMTVLLGFSLEPLSERILPLGFWANKATLELSQAGQRNATFST